MKKYDKSLKKLDTLLGIMLDWQKECDNRYVYAENITDFQCKTMDSLGLDKVKYGILFATVMNYCYVVVKVYPNKRYNYVRDILLEFCKDIVKPDVE